MRNTLCALAALACFSCGTPAPSTTPSTPATAAAGDLKPAGAATIGDRTKCLVTGEEFTVTADSPKVDYNGKTYFFCCKGCDKKFQADPQKYLSKS